METFFDLKNNTPTVVIFGTVHRRKNELLGRFAEGCPTRHTAMKSLSLIELRELLAIMAFESAVTDDSLEWTLIKTRTYKSGPGPREYIEHECAKRGMSHTIQYADADFARTLGYLVSRMPKTAVDIEDPRAEYRAYQMASSGASVPTESPTSIAA